MAGLTAMEWQKVCDGHYRARLDSGTYDARLSDGEWTLWFQANFTCGFIRRAGSWPTFAHVKRRAQVLNNDHFLQRTIQE